MGEGFPGPLLFLHSPVAEGGRSGSWKRAWAPRPSTLGNKTGVEARLPLFTTVPSCRAKLGVQSAKLVTATAFSPPALGCQGFRGRCRAGGGSGRGPSHWIIKTKGSLTAGCVAALGGPSGGGEGAQAVQLQVLAASPNSPDTMDPHLMLEVLQEVGRLRRRGVELAPFAVVERTLSGERGDPPPLPPQCSAGEKPQCGW